MKYALELITDNGLEIYVIKYGWMHPKYSYHIEVYRKTGWGHDLIEQQYIRRGLGPQGDKRRMEAVVAQYATD